jgi:DNA-binding CsgD family transcriptional regulator
MLAAPETAELTPREREIALLAAAGASSRQIAGRLVISVRTVDNHLRNAYSKLGVTRRQDLRRVLSGTPE